MIKDAARAGSRAARKTNRQPEHISSKDAFSRQLESIVRLHRKGASGTSVALALTRRMDALITSLYRGLDDRGKSSVSVVALGGYGRKELNFGSDTDIMFLIHNESVKKEAGSAVGQLLHVLLDFGLDVGHSFRTIEECVALAHGDLDSWISLLEARFICGNRKLFSHFHSAIVERIRTYDSAAFAQQLLASAEARHRKYGSSTTLLEPNVKNSQGGLRDLHTVFWLMRGTGRFTMPVRRQTNATALSAFLSSKTLRSLVDLRTQRELRASLNFILRTRNEMHLQAHALRDTLEFTSQRQVAEVLRYRSNSKRTSVERFMQDYYVAARVLSEVSHRILHGASMRYGRRSAALIPKKLDDRFILREEKIFPSRPRMKLNNEDVLVAFHHALEHNAAFSPDLEDAVTRTLTSVAPLRTIGETSLFRELLGKPFGVSRVVRMMNDLGLLGRWIPEWNGLVAFFQHNLYHFYTADEHTLMVLSNAEALQNASSGFGEVFRSLPRRDTLYLACLFHDIAKPKRIGDHEIIGVEMAKTILKRLRYTDVMEDVLFLIRHHLLMEQVALRRNLSDSQTILDFSSKFKNTNRLDLLYILTYADLCAVNKNVWTDWKGMLLYELYKQSRAVLEGKMTHQEFQAAETVRHKEAIEDLATELAEVFSHEEANSHLQAIDTPAYFAAFNSGEVADHIRRIRNNEMLSATFKDQNEFTEVAFIARDAPFLLSRFCAVLSANDANIFDANIFTRNDGIVIDKFRVVDFVTKSILSEDRRRKIVEELRDVLDGRSDIQQLLHRHHMKWKRRTRKRNPNIRIDVEFEDHPFFTIIDVYAPDTLGFLYKVTEVMSKLGLNISFAKIATRVDGIVDTFYVQDMTGGKLDTAEQRNDVRTELLKIVKELSESELVITPSI